MPEAPVHEDGHPPRGERDVGAEPAPGGQVEPVVLAEPVSLPVQRAAQREFWLGVHAPVRAHVRRAAGTGRGRVGTHERPA
jgi:hypothetical protein